MGMIFCIFQFRQGYTKSGTERVCVALTDKGSEEADVLFVTLGGASDGISPEQRLKKLLLFLCS